MAAGLSRSPSTTETAGWDARACAVRDFDDRVTAMILNLPWLSALNSRRARMTAPLEIDTLVPVECHIAWHFRIENIGTRGHLSHPCFPVAPVIKSVLGADIL